MWWLRVDKHSTPNPGSVSGSLCTLQKLQQEEEVEVWKVVVGDSTNSPHLPIQLIYSNLLSVGVARYDPAPPVCL